MKRGVQTSERLSKMTNSASFRTDMANFKKKSQTRLATLKISESCPSGSTQMKEASRANTLSTCLILNLSFLTKTTWTNSYYTKVATKKSSYSTRKRRNSSKEAWWKLRRSCASRFFALTLTVTMVNILERLRKIVTHIASRRTPTYTTISWMAALRCANTMQSTSLTLFQLSSNKIKGSTLYSQSAALAIQVPRLTSMILMNQWLSCVYLAPKYSLTSLMIWKSLTMMGICSSCQVSLWELTTSGPTKLLRRMVHSSINSNKTKMLILTAKSLASK